MKVLTTRRRLQLDAAQEIASRVIDLPLKKGNQFPVCQCHRLLGLIHRSKSEKEAAINHFEAALEIARSFGWHDELFWIHFCLAELFTIRTGSTALTLTLGAPSRMRSATHTSWVVWWSCRLGFGIDNVDLTRRGPRLCTLLIGATRDAEYTRELLRWINGEMNEGNLPQMALLPVCINFPFKARVTK